MARPRSLERCPRESEKQEGIRVASGPNNPRDTADSRLEQDLEVDATVAGAGQPAGERRQRRGGIGHRRGGTASREEQTPEARTLDMAAQRNRCARCEEEQAVESVRNAVGGTSSGSGTPTKRGLHVLMS